MRWLRRVLQIRPPAPGASCTRTAGLIGALAILGAGCGSSSESAPSTTTLDEPDLTVSMFEWGFGPRTVSMSAGSTVLLEVRNEGGLLHEWAVLANPIETEAEVSRDDIISAVSVEPGAVSMLEFTAPGLTRSSAPSRDTSPRAWPGRSWWSRVADIESISEEWSSKGAEFITAPIDRGAEIRCYLRDPDGHLIEVGQATGALPES